MTLTAAFVDGWRRVWRAPALVAGLLVLGLLLAAPLLATSLAAPAWSDLRALGAGTGILLSLVTRLGALTPPSQPETAALVAALTAHAFVVTFLAGGAVDRLARDRATGAHGFASAGGTCFFRVLRLAAIASPLFFLLSAITPRAIGSGPALAGAAVGWLLFHLVFDYALVRLVVEDRRSAVGAVTTAVRFVRRHLAAAAGLHVANAVVFLLLLVVMDRVVSPVGALIVRVLMPLVFAASAASLFQSRLAHAGYTARPVASWPESAAAEAVRPR